MTDIYGTDLTLLDFEQGPGLKHALDHVTAHGDSAAAFIVWVAGSKPAPRRYLQDNSEYQEYQFNLQAAGDDALNAMYEVTNCGPDGRYWRIKAAAEHAAREVAT